MPGNGRSLDGELESGPVREATFGVLRELGVTTIFGNPGSTELPFLKNFPKDFTFVMGLEESTVVGMADGYAQGSGGAVLVNLHTAPGLGNAMGAVVTAYHNKTPVVITAGQQDRRHLALEPLLSGRLVELARPYVKWSHEPARARDVPGAIERAYHVAMQAPRGPAFVSIPMDDWDAPAESFAVREVVHRSAPDPEALRMVAELLAASRRPAIVAGSGVDRAGAFHDAVKLAEKLRAAVWTDPSGSRAGFPQSHPLFQGHLAAAQARLAEQLSGHDAVLVLGAPVFAYYPYLPGPVVERGTTLVQITDDPAESSRAAAGTSIVGDVALAVRGLLELLPETDRPAPPARPEPEAPAATRPISPDYLMHTLAEALPDGAIVSEESPSNQGSLHRYLPIDTPGGYYNSASGGLQFALPAAVGLQLASPERKVVCVIGDGSSMYAIQALWSAARYDANILVVVVNNSRYGILESFGEFVGANEGMPSLELPGIDIPALARGFGCDCEQVEAPEELPGALRRAVDAGRPYVLDVAVDRTVPQLLG